MGIVGGGAYAERLVVHERQTMRCPTGSGLVDAAAIPEVSITAYDALVLQGGFTAGGWALVHAAGPGSALRRSSWRTRSGAGGGDVFRGQGRPVSRAGRGRGGGLAEEDFVAAVRGATGGAGVDVCSTSSEATTSHGT